MQTLKNGLVGASMCLCKKQLCRDFPVTLATQFLAYYGQHPGVLSSFLEFLLVTVMYDF